VKKEKCISRLPKASKLRREVAKKERMYYSYIIKKLGVKKKLKFGNKYNNMQLNYIFRAQNLI
jgi:hypothetical protein